jgi:sialate O-acetylesterase
MPKLSCLLPFSDNMVLQQKTKAAIWGKAEPGKTVNVQLLPGAPKNTAAIAGSDGKWKVMLIYANLRRAL